MILPQEKQPADLLDDIRAGFIFVKNHAREVRVREDLLADYARSLPARHPATVFDRQHHFISDDEATAAYVLALDAVNYGSGFVPGLIGEGWKISSDGFYFTMAARLKQRFDQKPMTAIDFRDSREESVRALFALPGGSQGDKITTLFTQGWRDLGDLIVKDHGGLFMNFVHGMRGQASRIVQALAALPQFCDIHDFEGRRVPLLKRAQSTAADLHDAFRHKGTTLFHDIDRLTVLADNDVPHVLRMDGLLEYDPALSDHVDAGLEIAAGSAREIEIRACAGYVVEKLAALKGVAPITLDRVLWHKSQEDPRYQSKPSHRTAGTFY